MSHQGMLRRARGVAIGAALITMGGLASGSTAHAVVSCSFAGTTATVTANANNDVPVIKRSGTAIQVNGTNCGAATTTTTDKIQVNGAAGNQNVTIDLAGGAIGPGKTSEGASPAVGEIEFHMVLGAGYDTITVKGTTGIDNLKFGTGGATLNTDSDVDVTFSGLEYVYLYGYAGNDVLSCGGGTSGDPLNKSCYIYGDTGVDTLTGGKQYDEIYGGDDATGTAPGDVIDGGGAYDKLYGDAGNDNIKGGDGGDRITGGLGNDTIDGGDGDDNLTYVESASPDGADVYRGGGGLGDHVSYRLRTTNIVVDTDGGADDGADTNADGVADEKDSIYDDVENMDLGTKNDTYLNVGPIEQPNYVNGGDGNDNIDPGSDNDTVYGQNGDDTLAGTIGNDRLDGGLGVDKITGGEGDDRLYGGPGADTVDGGPGDDDFYNENTLDGADIYTGGLGFDARSGSAAARRSS